MLIPSLSSIHDFIAWEETQEEKYEYADGEVSLFPGGTNRHMTIALNVAIALRLRGLAPGTVFNEVKTVTERSSRYPDIAVTLDKRDRPENTFVRYPLLLVEVLSPSTEGVDRGAKLDEYRSIETLEEYALIDSRKRWAQIFRRVEEWWIVSLPIVTGELELRSVGATIAFDELYAGTEL
jgi:Uma2 family endonuclease